jgi:hypothetical protein
MVPKMPNNLRTLANEEELYVIMVPLWCDDVSGNRSKQYNKHINMYMANSNLPGQLLQQEYFVCFVATSPNATSPEQFSAVMADIKSEPYFLVLYLYSYRYLVEPPTATQFNVSKQTHTPMFV